jgi:hypothetical protein
LELLLHLAAEGQSPYLLLLLLVVELVDALEALDLLVVVEVVDLEKVLHQSYLVVGHLLNLSFKFL